MAEAKQGRAACRAWLLATVAILPGPLLARPALAQRPTGGQVVGGSAAIAQTPARTTVTQSSDRAAIDWRQFNVGAGHEVAFRQPAATSWTLNRVTGPDPSVIAGRITANGGVALVNPSGMVFAQGAQVNVGSLIASAANVTTQNFMAGRMVFDGPPKLGARTENRGSVTVAERGIAALVAPEVANSGTIRARLGKVALAGAETYALDLAGDGLLSIDVTQAVRQAPGGGVALVTNSGTIEAAGGSVLLTAHAASGLVETLVSNPGVSNTGRIAAPTVADRGGAERTGTVALRAEGGGTRVAGRVAARGGAARPGGTVEVNATGAVTLAPGAVVDASGGSGGGRAFIGTTGAGPGQRLAARTEVAAGARVRADATRNGQGGSIVVNAQESTLFQGAASARGGPEGGDGGLVELSGQGGMDIHGTVDVRAPAGRAGSVLLDPDDIFIVAPIPEPNIAVAAPGLPAIPLPGNLLGVTTAESATFLEAHSGTVTNTDPGNRGRVLGGTEVLLLSNETVQNFAAPLKLEARNNLTVLAPVSRTINSLELSVTNGQIDIQQPVSATVLTLSASTINLAASLSATTGITVNVSGPISVAVPLTASAGGITLTGGGSVITTATDSLDATGPISVTAAAPGAIQLGGPVIARVGDITLNGAGGVTVAAGTLNAANGLTVTAAGPVSLGAAPSGTLPLPPTILRVPGPISIATAGPLTIAEPLTSVTGGITLSGAGGVTTTAGVGLSALGTINVFDGVFGGGPIAIAGPLTSSGGAILLNGAGVTTTAQAPLNASGPILVAASASGAVLLGAPLASTADGITLSSGSGGVTTTAQAPLNAAGPILVTASAPGAILLGAPASTTAQGITLTGAGGVTTTAQASLSAPGAISLEAAGPIVVNAPIAADAAGIAITGGVGGIATADAARLSAPGAITLIAPGGIDNRAPIQAGGLITLSTGTPPQVFQRGEAEVILADAGSILVGLGPLANAGLLQSTVGGLLMVGRSIDNAGPAAVAGDIALRGTTAVLNRAPLGGRSLLVTGATVENQARLAIAGGIGIGTDAGAAPTSRILSAGEATAGGPITLQAIGPGGPEPSLDIRAPATGAALTLSGRGVRLGAGLAATAGNLLAAASPGALEVVAGTRVSASGDVTLSGGGGLTNAGTVQAGGRASLSDAGGLRNTGTVIAGTDAVLEDRTTGTVANEGTVIAGNALTLDAQAPGVAAPAITNSGSLVAGTGPLRVVASGDATIANSGSITATAGDVALGAATIGNTGSITAGGASLALRGAAIDAGAAGTLAAPRGRVALDATRGLRLSGGVDAGAGLALNGNDNPIFRVLLVQPGFGQVTLAGARITADQVTIRAPGGVGAVGPLSTLRSFTAGAVPSLAIDTTGNLGQAGIPGNFGLPAGTSRNVVQADGAVRLNLDAGIGLVSLRLGAGAARGTLLAAGLEVVGRGGLARLTGALGGRADGTAALLGTLLGPVDALEQAAYLFNGCVIGAAACGLIPLDTPPINAIPPHEIGIGQIPLSLFEFTAIRRAELAAGAASIAAAGQANTATPELIRLRRSRGRLTDPDIVLPNAIDEDY